MFAFMFTGAFATATMEAFSNEHNELGCGLAAITGLIYAGNIFSAVNVASSKPKRSRKGSWIQPELECGSAETELSCFPWDGASDVKLYFFTLMIGAVLLIATPAFAGGIKGPWELDKKRNIVNENHETAPGSYITLPLIRFFQKYISPVDGERCPCFPTCSSYSLQAYRKHVFFIGTLMTVDRLFHEADIEKHAPLRKVGDRDRFIDPLENNDFWFADH
ncbi:MAG: membrane protein insertion efficiency factor YidD [Deltaproteobacteria bacterium]|nr:membrane protein insertion efficiency factor YidD [Deltaproteobacteria bacterium]